MKLRLEHVTLALSGKTILEDLNFEAVDGSFTSVLGPSGCGKSSLLKTIAGIIPDFGGSIFINGQDTANILPHKRGAVIVFQDIRLFPHMSVAQNVGYPLKVKGVSRKDYQETVLRLLEQVQLKGFAHSKPKHLSGGEQQRVALARALAAKPEILLLDEPFSGLDENLRFDMRFLLMKLHREYGMTTIMVTHDKEEAFGMADIVMVMEKGRILQTGSPEDIFEKPDCLSVARYLGNAAFIRGNVLGGRFESTEFSFDCGEVDGAYMLMVRYADLIGMEGDDFGLVHTTYTERGYEYFFEHVVTGLKIRLNDAGYSHLGGKCLISIELPMKKIKLFHL